MATAIREEVRELAYRESDGLEVVLLWRTGDNRLTVSVWDAKTGDAFELPVEPREKALDVFHHPYPYAASRGIAYTTRPRAGEAIHVLALDR